MGQVDKLISRLASEGEVDSRGGFTLDRAKAREKMRRFQLADSTRWILLAVEALVVRGATRVDIHVDSDDVIVSGDARPLPRVLVENPWDAMFSADAPEPGGRELALALNATASIRPRWARIESGDGGQLHVLELRAEGGDPSDVREVFSQRADAFAGIRLHVKYVLGFPFVDAIFKIDRPERQLVVQHTSYAHVPVTVNGEVVSQGWRLPPHVEVHAAPAAPLQPLVGLDVTGKHAMVYVVSNGVLIERKPIETEAGGFPPGFVAMIDASTLDKDVSHARIVEDARWRATLDQLRALSPRLDHAIAKWAATSGNKIPRRLVEYLRVQLACYSDDPYLAAASDDAREALASLSVLRLWETIEQAWVSAEDVRASPGICGWVTESPRWNKLRRAEALAPGQEPRPAFFLEAERPPNDVGYLFPARDGSAEAAQLLAVFGERGHRVDDRIRDAIRREAAIDAWRRRPLAATFGEGVWRGRAVLGRSTTGVAMRGEVVLRSAAGTASSVALTKGGHVLFTLELRGIDGIAAIVEANFETTPDWSTPVADDTFLAVLAALGEAIVAVGSSVDRATAPEEVLPPLSFYEQLAVAAVEDALGTAEASLDLVGPLDGIRRGAVEALQAGIRRGLALPEIGETTAVMDAWEEQPIANIPWLRAVGGYTSIADVRRRAVASGNFEIRVVAHHKRTGIPREWSDVIVADKLLRGFLGAALPGCTLIDVTKELRIHAERVGFQRKPLRPMRVFEQFDGARFPRRFDDEQAELRVELGLVDTTDGWLQIACMVEDEASADMGRDLARDKTMFALPGWVAVVSGPGVRMRPGHSEVESRAMQGIRRVVRRAVAARIVEFAAALASRLETVAPSDTRCDEVDETTMRGVVVKALRAFLGLSSYEEGMRDLRVFWRDHEGTLLAAPVIPTTHGVHTSLAVLEERAKSSKVAFARSTREAQGESEPVPLLDDEMLELVTTRVDSGRLSPVTHVRARRELDAKLADAPVLARIDLSDQDVLVRTALSRLPGEVGIPRLHPSAAAGALVRVASRGRLLCEIRPELDLPVRAIIDMGSIEYDVTRDQLPRSAWKRAVKQLRDSMDSLLAELVRRAPEFSTEDRRLAGTWVLSEVARRAPGCAGNPKAGLDGFVELLVEAPLFLDGQGSWQPLRAFGGPTGLAVRAPSPSEGEQVPPVNDGATTLVFVEAPGEREWLNRVFPQVEDESARARRLAHLATALDTMPAARVMPDDAVHQRVVRPKGEYRSTGTLWLPNRLSDVRGIDCTHRGRVVGAIEVDLPCDGVLVVEAHVVPSESGAPRLSAGELHRLQKHVYELWKDVVERAEKEDRARRGVRAATLIADLCFVLDDQISARSADDDDDWPKRLFERASKLHVLRSGDGRWLSYEKAKAHYPRLVSDWRRGMAELRDAAGRMLASSPPVGEPRSGTPVAGPFAPEPAGGSAREGESSSSGGARSGKPPAADVATVRAGPMSEGAWMDALRELLRGHRPPRTPPFETLLADGLRLQSMDGRRIIRTSGHGLVVDRLHPIVKASMTHDGPSRIALAMVASALYSVINALEEKVSDEDEVKFNASLLRSFLPEAREDDR